MNETARVLQQTTLLYSGSRLFTANVNVILYTGWMKGEMHFLHNEPTHNKNQVSRDSPQPLRNFSIFCLMKPNYDPVTVLPSIN